MPVPGRFGHARMVHHGGTTWRLGACLETQPSGSLIAGTTPGPEQIAVSLSGFGESLQSAMADSAGQYPKVFGNPNIDVTLSRHVYEDGIVDQTWWISRPGAVNTEGCDVGLVNSHEIRLRLLSGSAQSSWALYAFVLMKTTQGECHLVQYFTSGTYDIGRLAEGQAVTLSNKLGRGPLTPRIFTGDDPGVAVIRGIP